MARFVRSRDGKTDELTDGPVDIGRGVRAHIRLNQDDVSREHAKVFKVGDKWQIVDTKSKGGTYVHGRKLLPGQFHTLRHGDIIKVGSITLTFEDEEELLRSEKNEAAQEVEVTNDIDSSIEESASGSGFGSMLVRPEQKLSGILRINEALAGNVDFRAICPRVLDTLFDLFPQADEGAIALLQDEGRNPLKVAQRHRNAEKLDSVKISKSVLNLVLEANAAIVSPNTKTDPVTSGSDSIISNRIHSTMYAPMMGLDGKPFGIIILNSQNPSHRFSNDDLQLLLAVASQAAHAFENARMLTISVTEKLRQERQDEEMKISAEVQRKLIPSELPQPHGYQFYGSYDAAAAVGGDYFDCFEMADGKICVSFGDVSGKGVPAALIMSRLSGIVSSIMSFTDDVGLAMSRINSLMWRNMVEGRYVTYLLGVVDPETHTFTFANAGHLPPEVRSQTGGVTCLGTDASGFPIGIFEHCQFQTQTIQLEPGTTVILRTDGVDDAESPSLDLYGIQRFRNLLCSDLEDPRTIGKALLADVRTFIGEHKQRDDITIMSFGRMFCPSASFVETAV